MTIVPFPEWLPDQPDFASAGAPVIKNCVPSTKASYGPMPTPQPYSLNTLDDRCQGSYVIRDATGAPYVYAGDATKLYRMPPAFDSFFDVSRVTGVYTTPSPSAGGFWSMTAFGNRIIASNYTDAIQSMLLSGTNFDVLSPDAPRAKFVTTVKDFVFAANTIDPVDGAVPYRVWWSGLGQPDQWPTPGSVTALQLQSDYQDLQQQDLGAITGMVAGFLGGASDVAIFCENGVWGGNYVGPPLLFSFRVIAGAPGTLSPLSIVPGRMRTAAGSAAQVAMYLSESGFQAFDGAVAIPFGAGKFDREFFRELNGAWIGYVQGVADPGSNLVYWAFASETSEDGLFDRLLVYNWELARAVICELEGGFPNQRSEWLTRGLFGSGYTLDTIDHLGNLDTIQPPFDDPFWQGTTAGRLTTFAPDHRLHTWVGPAMAPTLDLPETQPVPGRRSWVTNARPLIDAGDMVDATVQVGVRERLTQPVVWSAQIPVDILGNCPQRTTGRYVRLRFAMAPGVSFQALQGLDVDTVPEGKLR